MNTNLLEAEQVVLEEQESVAVTKPNEQAEIKTAPKTVPKTAPKNFEDTAIDTATDKVIDTAIDTNPIEPEKKKGVGAKFKNYLEQRNQKKNSKKHEQAHVASVLKNIDTHLDSLVAYNQTLIEEVENLRRNNDELLVRLEKMRKRELLSKIVAIITGVVSIVLVVLKLFGIM